MTALLEWQAKALLASAGIAVPDGGVATDVTSAVAVAERIGFPCAVKGQVRRGDRAAVGLVQRAGDADAIARVTAEILGSSAAGEPVGAVLVERWHDLDEELYLAVASDLDRRVPTLLTMASGGTGVEHRTGELRRIDLPADAVVSEHELWELLRLALGRSGQDLAGAVRTVRAMLDLYRSHDCWLVEVNPLARTADGWLAVDVKVRVDADAVLLAGRDTTEGLPDVLYAEREATSRELAAIDIDRRDHRGSVHYVELDPGGEASRARGQLPVAMHCVGTGASLTLMDELEPRGLTPVNFCDTSGSPSEAKVHEITRIVLEQPGIVGYLFVSSLATQELRTTAAGIISALRDVRAVNGDRLPFPVLIVLRGNQDEEALEDLRTSRVLDDPDRSLMGRDATERTAAERFVAMVRGTADGERGGAVVHGG